MLVVLPQGIVDRRGDNYSDGELRQIVEEQQADYDNFDKNSLLGESFDGDRFDGMSRKENVRSSLGGWDINEFDKDRPARKKRKQKKDFELKKEMEK